MAANQPGMVNQFVLGGKTYRVDPKTKLGAGSEGTVVAHPSDPSLCVKLLHPPDPSKQDAANIAAFQGRKIAYICGRHLILPPQFIMPQVPVFNTAGDVAGFQMRLVPPGYQKLMKLLDSAFRTSHGIGLRTIMSLYADLFEDLGIIHGNKMVVGDVNLGCVMFEPGGSRAWVDTSSWGDEKYPCLATTEMFAHPDLYPNLQGSGKLVWAQPHHDRFSFLIALTMMAIPGAHPFRMGKHPTVSGLQNRAKAGITIFDADVKVPPMLGSPEVLSDDLLNLIIERLKRKVNTPIDPDVLRAFTNEVSVCGNCDAEYHRSRKHCPRCKTATMVQATVLVNFLIEELYKTPGTLLFAQLVEDYLYLVCRVGTRVQVIRVDTDGVALAMRPDLPNVRGARYRFFGSCLVVCADPAVQQTGVLDVFQIDGTTLTPSSPTSSGVLEGEGVVFDTSTRFLYRVASNALLRCEPFGAKGIMVDTHVAEVHQRQSWFTADHSTGADREVIFGYDRALRNWQWFIIHGNAKGSRYQYYDVGDLGLHTGETVEDFAVYFSASSVLLVMQTSYNGLDYVRYAVIGLDGTVHQNNTIDSSDSTYAYWATLRGKLYQGKSVLHATANGVVKQQLSDGSCTTLSDTTGLVTSDDQLFRLNGRVGIVRRSGVLAMTPKKK